VHGVILLDKPLGLSSNQALQRVKWLLRAEKAGHTGTLDPLATGVLPLCFGAATKFSQLHLDADKTYRATARLGLTTDTGDAEGQVLCRRDVNINANLLAKLEAAFTGDLTQIPPMYSALKKDGRTLYSYAREGVEVDRPARNVKIYSLKIASARMDKGEEAIEFVAKCSKGTYIRTLAQDMGEALGCGAYLTALRRIQTGDFNESQCISLEALEAMTEPQRLACLLPVDTLLARHTPVLLDEQNAGRFLSGMRRRGDWPDSEAVAVYAESDRALLGVGHIQSGELIPDRLLSPLDIRQVQQQSGLQVSN
jgi:tRNA pseudouridine55 synthase